MSRTPPVQTAHTCLNLLDADLDPLSDGKVPSIPRLRYLGQLRPRPVQSAALQSVHVPEWEVRESACYVVPHELVVALAHLDFERLSAYGCKVAS